MHRAGLGSWGLGSSSYYLHEHPSPPTTATTHLFQAA